MRHILDLAAADQHQFFIDNIPHNRLLRMQLGPSSRGQLSFVLPHHPAIIGAPAGNAAHTGALTSALDAAMGSSVLTWFDQAQRSATLDLRVDFLRGARPGADLCCETRCLSVSDHLAVVGGLAHDGDRDDPVAIATGRFAVFPLRPGFDLELEIALGRSSPERPATAEAMTAAPAAGDTALPTALADQAYLRSLGLKLDMAATPVRGLMPYHERVVGNPKVPALHGGALATLMQVTAAAELMKTSQASSAPLMSSCTIEYLRSAELVDCQASAAVVTRSRRYANLRAAIWQSREDQPVAVATVHFLLAG